MESKKKDFAVRLYEIGAIKFGQFRLKLHEKKPDLPPSPIYIDLRLLRSYPEDISLAVDVFGEMVKDLEFELYADVPTAATPFVALLSHKTKVPMITPRSDKKKYGSMKPIDGAFKAGQTALVIDDLITRAESKIEAIKLLKLNGLLVKDVAVLIDRQQGGEDEIAKEDGCRLHSVFKLKQLLELYVEMGLINKSVYNDVINYISIDFS